MFVTRPVDMYTQQSYGIRCEILINLFHLGKSSNIIYVVGFYKDHFFPMRVVYHPVRKFTTIYLWLNFSKECSLTIQAE